MTRCYGSPGMRNRWPVSVGIAVVGVLAGFAIAGRPTVSDSFLTNAATSTSSGPSSSVANSPVATSTPATFDTVVTSDSLMTTTTDALPAPTTPPAASTTTAVPTSTASTTTASPPETTVPSPSAETVDRSAVRIVLANGDGRFNLVGANKSRLEAAGYVSIDQEDVASATATILYYRPGFDDEAAIVAADLLVPQALLQPLPDTPVTDSDAAGDIIVILGPDAVR